MPKLSEGAPKVGNTMGKTVKRAASGLVLQVGPDVGALVDRLVAALAAATSDPFEAPLVLTPGAGVRRWVSQHIARRSDPGGAGVCTGVAFEASGRLPNLLTGSDPADDPWAPERLVWPILSLADAGSGPLEPLTKHLAANEQRYANALRVARLLDRYARYRPALLEAWLGGEGADLGYDAWQPALWRALHEAIDAPDPVERADRLRRGLLDESVPVPWPAVMLVLPRHIAPGEVDLLGALARRVPVHAFVYRPDPPVGTFPLRQRLGGRADDVVAALEPVADRVERVGVPGRVAQVEVHASHGLDRQTEVLREVLARLFADDPTLQPRDVVVATPSVPELAPFVTAAFTAVESGGGWRHPGYRFRVQVAAQSAAEVNQLLHLVRSVTELGQARGTAGDLLDFCTHPFVARQFGFSDDAVERLEGLVPQAAIRWGVNGAHRAQFGLGNLRQNTWVTGVQRLMLGEALADSQGSAVGVISPVDDVESTDIALLGGFAELVSRLIRLSTECRVPATASGWVERFRAMAEQLADVPFAESWQLGQLWSVLERLERRGARSDVLLGPADALALLDAEFASRTARPAFGNGSLVVCGLPDLAQVPHRVVCLVGLDDRRFPRRDIADGDDLLAADPRPGDPNPGADDRQALLDALGSARERLVVLFQGRSSHTNEEYPAPSGLVDLMEAVGAPRINEALQPFSPRYFTGAPTSFDVESLRAARALAGPREKAPGRFEVAPLPLAEPVTHLELDALASFASHPAKYFCRQRAQLTFGDDEQLADAIPLEIDGLSRWKIGTRLLDELLAGGEPAEIEHRERLRGELPPGLLGSRALAEAMEAAQRVYRNAAPLLSGSSGFEAIDLDAGGVRLTGRLTPRGDTLVQPQFSRVAPGHLATAWVSALALAASTGRPARATLIDTRSRHTLEVASPDSALEQLTTLGQLAVLGLEEVLPMPARVCEFWARARREGRDPFEGYDLRDAWRNETTYDDVWRHFFPRGTDPWGASVTGEPWAQRGEKTRLGSLAMLVWAPILEAQA